MCNNYYDCIRCQIVQFFQILSTEVRRGNEFEEIDANGYTRNFIKGDDGQLLSYIDSSGFDYRTEYNENGLISAFLNPDGNRTQVFYDDEGHINRILNSDGSGATFTYDSDDRVVSLEINLVYAINVHNIMVALV